MSADYLKPFHKGYVAPNNEHLIAFRNNANLNTKEMAAIVGKDDKAYRKLLNEKNYLKGQVIDYCEWRILLETYQLVEPFKLSQYIPEIRPEVFTSEDFKTPNFYEFSYLCKRTGYAADTIAQEINIPAPVIEAAINHPSDQVMRLHKDDWLAFLKKNGIDSLESLKKVPDINLEFLSPGNNFEAPRPNQLRRFISWTGFTPDQFEEMLDIKASKLTYLMSNRSGRYSNVKLPDTIFSRDGWAPPFSHELRDIIKATWVDPGAVARHLKMSRNEVHRILKTPRSYRLPVTQDNWFHFLEKIQVFSADHVRKKLSRESRTHNISYAHWIYLLSIFGLVDLANLK